jgi:hypothetical protein
MVCREWIIPEYRYVVKFNLNHLQDDPFQILYQDKEIKTGKYKCHDLGLDKHTSLSSSSLVLQP